MAVAFEVRVVVRVVVDDVEVELLVGRYFGAVFVQGVLGTVDG